jgi:Ca2+-binding EF-hand superfamily protein
MRLIEYYDNTTRKESDHNIKEAFNVYDADSDGYINANDIYHIITRIGSGQLSKAEADILLEDFEPDARKRIRTSELK